jgi:aminoglycoside phosphotransferase (APT) family kinase protein
MPAEGYPFVWAVYQWVHGECATTDRISDHERFATDLAHFVAALRRIDPSGGPAPGEHSFFRGVPLVTRDVATRAAITSLDGSIDVDRVTAAWEEAR